MWAIEDQTAVVVVASHRSVSRNPVRFKALFKMLEKNQCHAILGKGSQGGVVILITPCSFLS